MSGKARLARPPSATAPAGKAYPGGTCCAADIFLLAEEYRLAAGILRRSSPCRGHLSQAPFRLAAIHAVELYLNAFLLAERHPPAFIRGLQHDLAARADHAAGLRLRKRTLAHLRQLGEAREYLVTRYAPESAERMSQLNRLEATLEEIRRKVGAHLKRPG